MVLLCPSMSERRVRYHVNIPVALDERLRDRARVEHRSLNSLILWSVERYLDTDDSGGASAVVGGVWLANGAVPSGNPSLAPTQSHSQSKKESHR